MCLSDQVLAVTEDWVRCPEMMQRSRILHGFCVSSCGILHGGVCTTPYHRFLTVGHLVPAQHGLCQTLHSWTYCSLNEMTHSSWASSAAPWLWALLKSCCLAWSSSHPGMAVASYNGHLSSQLTHQQFSRISCLQKTVQIAPHKPFPGSPGCTAWPAVPLILSQRFCWKRHTVGQVHQ